MGDINVLDRSAHFHDLPWSSAAASTARRASIVPLREQKTHCATCTTRELCLPVGLEPAALRALDDMVTFQTRCQKGAALFRANEPFEALYAIRCGSFKTTVLGESGREQITAYHLPGDLIGLDGIASKRHACEAVALEDSDVCSLPFDELERLGRIFPSLQHNIHRFLSRDIGRDQKMMLMLGNMRADERLAGFLVNLSDRYRQRGYSSTEFVLRMTRADIGSHLGLKLETISRLFSRFQGQGLLHVQGRCLKLDDLVSLRKLAACA